LTGAAVENARRYQRASYTATLEERERLAREMHDRLAQDLGYLHLQVALTEGLLGENRVAQAQTNLRELKQVSEITYTDVREAIFNLRTVLASGLRFLPSLEGYLSEYRLHYGLETHLMVDGVDLARFPPDVDVQLFRIIQEALANVRKHARANKVRIGFQKEADSIGIEIEDDGCGFELEGEAQAAASSFGLQIMRERAECVGGTLDVSSSPGGGTRVRVQVPYEKVGQAEMG
jgi:signal transduction histidine kinase